MAPKYRSPRTIGLLNSYTLTTAAGALTVPVRNAYSPSAVITIVAASEVGTASVQMAVNCKMGAGADVAIVPTLSAAITAAGTYRYSINSAVMSFTGMTQAFDGVFVTQDFDIVLTCTGGGASMDITMAVAFI